MWLWDWFLGKPTTAPAKPLPAGAPPAEAAPAPPEPPEPKPAPAPKAPAVPAFDVDNAIALMRKLPLNEEPELVLRIVRKTLQSTGVSIEEVIRSAKRRESTLSEEIEKDRAAIDQHERDIAELRANIESSSSRLGETRKVRASLQEAVAGESKIDIGVPQAEIARIQAEAAAKKVKPPDLPKPADVAPKANTAPPPLPPKSSRAPPLPRKSSKPDALPKMPSPLAASVEESGEVPAEAAPETKTKE
jgi:hypothetical protein